LVLEIGFVTELSCCLLEFGVHVFLLIFNSPVLSVKLLASLLNIFYFFGYVLVITFGVTQSHCVFVKSFDLLFKSILFRVDSAELRLQVLKRFF